MSGDALGRLRRRHLDLMIGCLTRDLFPETEQSRPGLGPSSGPGSSPDNGTRSGVDPSIRREGRDWPAEAETMIGRLRMDNLAESLAAVLDDGIPGDLAETGVWRGGATILMRAALEAWGDEERRVWVADSFRGLPPPDAERWPADEGVDLSGVDALAVSRAEVEAAFARYGLLDDRVRFLEGWFCETLPSAPIDRLALLRLDGDLYQSTWEALESLYPKLSVGGILIVDDYGAFEPCRQAVGDYREAHGITEPIREVDWTGVWWRRER